jgi:hypothetical protein
VTFLGLFLRWKTFVPNSLQHVSAVTLFAASLRTFRPGLPDFSGFNVPKLGKVYQQPLKYQMAIKYGSNMYIPDGHKMRKHFAFQSPPQFSQI